MKVSWRPGYIVSRLTRDPIYSLVSLTFPILSNHGEAFLSQVTSYNPWLIVLCMACVSGDEVENLRLESAQN